MDTKAEKIKAFTQDSVHDIPIQVLATPPKHDEDISETFMNEVNRVRAQAYAWQEWFICELEWAKQRIEELEIELMLAENDIDRPAHNFTDKKRTLLL